MRTKFGGALVSLSLLLSLNLLMPSRPGFGTAPVKSGIGAAELSAYGDVFINGDPSASGTAIFPGVTITTGPEASAIITFGERGRIELLPITTLKLDFGKGSINCELIGGAARVSSAKGVVATLSTKDGSIISDGAEPSKFSVAVSDSSSFSRFAGNLRLKNNGAFDEQPPGNFFRPAISDLTHNQQKDSKTRPSKPFSAFSEKLAVLLIGIGVVFAAVTGLDSNRDQSFFRVGGSPAVNPRGSK